jgi:hypothetical protein
LGDNSRFIVFAEFIERNWPNVRTIADIGGGSGLLSLELSKRGYEPTVFEPSRTNTRASMRHAARRREISLSGSQKVARSRLVVRNTRFCRSILSEYDLLIGLHPDEATEIIIRVAIEMGKPFAVVPCCVMPLNGRCMLENDWMRYLQDIDKDIRSAMLDCSGKNTVLYRR